MTEPAPQDRDTADAHCPHCGLVVQRQGGSSWPPEPTRCPHCRLLIASGRALSDPSSNTGTKGTAASVFSRRAKREELQAVASPEEVLAAIRATAEQLGQRPERLMMLDYQQRSLVDSRLPPLRDVFAAFGSWKRARREAGS